MTSPGTSPVPSPCKSVCILDTKTGYCQGCGRSAEEVGAWFRGSDEEKRAILAAVERRRKQGV